MAMDYLSPYEALGMEDPRKAMETAYTTEDRLAALERYRKQLTDKYKQLSPSATVTTPTSYRYSRSGGASGQQVREDQYLKAMKEKAEGEARGFTWRGPTYYKTEIPGTSTTTNPWESQVSAIPKSEDLLSQYFQQYQAKKPQYGTRASGRSQDYLNFVRGSIYQ